MASRIFRHLDALQATLVWQRAPRWKREAMLSAGGSGAGGVWISAPCKLVDYFTNSHFRAATRRRLCILKPVPGSMCCIPERTRDDSEPQLCGQGLDVPFVHPLLCKCGVARMRPHRALAGAMAKWFRQAGAEADLERVVPELLAGTPGLRAADARPGEQPAVEARLDIVSSFPGGCDPMWIDVSIRCPHARRY
eukprot:9748981-Karenia_brevis.AAC.1